MQSAKSTIVAVQNPGYRRATLLVNPSARGVGQRADPKTTIAYLDERGVSATLVVTNGPAEATQAAAASAARGDDLLFVVGGDGSMRVAAQGLAGSDTALAAVPAGTVNIWAREAGIPLNHKAAIDAHLSGQRARIDLGRAGESCFLLMAGIGWDAEVTRRVPRDLKRTLGDAAYVLQGAGMLPGLRPRFTRWRVDGLVHQEPLAVLVVGNTRLYGGVLQLTPGAQIDDGEFDIVAFCPRSVMDGIRLGLKAAVGRTERDPRIIRERGAHVMVETPHLAVQLDGDFHGETPIDLRIETGALMVSVPAGPLPPIFRRPE